MKYKEQVCELLADYNTEQATESDLRKRYRDTEFEYYMGWSSLKQLKSDGVKAGILEENEIIKHL